MAEEQDLPSSKAQLSPNDDSWITDFINKDMIEETANASNNDKLQGDLENPAVGSLQVIRKVTLWPAYGPFEDPPQPCPPPVSNGAEERRNQPPTLPTIDPVMFDGPGPAVIEDYPTYRTRLSSLFENTSAFDTSSSGYTAPEAHDVDHDDNGDTSGACHQSSDSKQGQPSWQTGDTSSETDDQSKVSASETTTDGESSSQ